MLFELESITIGVGNTNWGAPDNECVFILKLGKCIKKIFILLPYIHNHVRRIKINFRLWHIVGGIYEYKTLIRLPRKQKKALKKNLLQEIFTIDRNYLKECPKPKKCQYLVINKNKKDINNADKRSI